MESELVSIPSADTNSDSDTDSIDTGIDASGILDYPAMASHVIWILQEKVVVPRVITGF